MELMKVLKIFNYEKKKKKKIQFLQPGFIFEVVVIEKLK